MRRSTWFLLILWCCTNGLWAYQHVDRAITDSYRDQTAYEARHHIEALSRLGTLALRGTPQADALSLLQQASPELTPYEKDGALRTTWLALHIGSDGRVVEVSPN
jgi:hypothetical protein